MKTIEVDSWEDYEKTTQALFEEAERKRKAAKPLFVSKLLFRGQSNSAYLLENTLERYWKPHVLVTEYYDCISRAKSQIETLTDKRWSTHTPPDFRRWLREQTMFGLGDFPGYEYLVYLRHHGFPSPLLDWSQSPYVAAFFAFQNARPPVEKVSVFVYQEYTGHPRSGSIQAPQVFGQGPYVTSHRRHVLQQSEYTICVQNINNEWVYASHDDALRSSDGEQQDALIKINLPVSQRTSVMMKLDRFNLNAFSLFGSEESLMETVANRTITFPKE